jgi:hypothetical protein
MPGKPNPGERQHALFHAVFDRKRQADAGGCRGRRRLGDNLSFPGYAMHTAAPVIPGEMQLSPSV